jgi:hypothetical protein
VANSEQERSSSVAVAGTVDEVKRCAESGVEFADDVRFEIGTEPFADAMLNLFVHGHEVMA